jgi:thiol:disulfide interchange protein
MFHRLVRILIVTAHIAVAANTAAAGSPSRAPTIYPDPAQAHSDLAAGLKRAADLHRRVIVDFGANWCGDCRVLDMYFNEEPNSALLQSNFVLVHVNIGDGDQNLDLAARFRIPLFKGVPALAVLSESGELIFRQHSGEFEGMRRMSSSAVTEFLMRWKLASN